MIDTQIDREIHEESTDRRRSVGIAALLGLIFCWGCVPVLLRDLAGALDAWTANGLRYPFSALCYWSVLWWRRDRISWQLIFACMVPALFSTCGQVFWALAHYHLQASQIGFLARVSMVFAIGGALIVFADERRLLKQPRFYVGLLMAVGGFVALALTGEGGVSIVDANLRGLTIMFLCTMFFGFYVVTVRWFLPDVDALLAFAIVAQFCSVGLIIGTFVNGDYSIVTQLTPRSWGLIIASSILGIGLGHMLMYMSVQRLGAALTTSCQCVTPFLTVAIAGIFLGERMTPSQWVAGVVILAGALMLLSVKQVVGARH